MIRTKIWYALLLVFFLLFSILYNEYFTFILFLIMVALPILLWLVFMTAKRYVDIGIETAEYIYSRGTPYDITIRVNNRFLMPIPKMKIYMEYYNCFTKEKNTELLDISLESKSEVALTVTCSSQFCGLCCYRINKVVLYDYLTLFSFRKRGCQEIEVAILPTFHMVEEQLAKENPSVLVESELFSASKSGDDPSEIHSIRSYVQGDRMNRIHWKLSLKTDELIVKEFGLPVNCSVAIMADFYTKDIPITLPKLDAMIEILLSLSISMVYQEQIHYIIWYDELRENCQRCRVEREEDCYEAIALLYRCKLKGISHNLAMFHEAQYSAEKYTNIFYLTSFLDEDIITSLNAQRKSAITQLYVVHEEEEDFAEFRKEALSLGMKAYGLPISQIGDSLLSTE